jgi:membrane-associated protease RseP (regulator of RpoE activity)
VIRHIRQYLTRFLHSVLLHPRRGPYLSVVLFLLTAASIYWTGGPAGPRLVAGVLAILLAHEGGHYAACRIHGVASTWPLLLPAPIVNPITGTLGAVMVIRSPFPNRRALFDIGAAGPLAGMAVCLPLLWLGLHDISFLPHPSDPNIYYLGNPLAFDIVAHWVTFDAVPPGMEPRLGPLAAASWFGFLLTGLNLVPLGQLDGGHILYALFPRRALLISRVLWWSSLGLIVLSPSWILWSVLTRLLTRPHPPTLDDRRPLGWVRVIVSLVALIVLVISFMPEPVLGGWSLLFAR